MTRKRKAAYQDQCRIPDELRAKIGPLLAPGKPHPLGYHNPPVDPRKAMDAIFFVLRTGCQWNALNATGICSSSWAHRRYQEWTAAGVFQKLWALGLQQYDQLKGIDWSWQSMDGAMTKAPLGGGKSGLNPADGAERGVQRSLLTEAAGMPISLAVDGANRHDGKTVNATLESVPVKRPQGICFDRGYDSQHVRELVKAFGYAAYIKARGEEARAIKQQAPFKARRWVVERTDSWMNRFRRILIRWEKKPQNYLGLLHLVCAIIIYRAAGPLG